ncbi:hypothetical protein M0805_007359 [Coniferiporia weirii]|nr:hypothetical protein M0805_007359 [Coniferiporia weirii]
MFDKLPHTPVSPPLPALAAARNLSSSIHDDVMSSREWNRLAGRLSPEPHLEMMRPVSPFQNKRQLAHQQPQSNLPSNSFISIHHHPQPNSQPYTHGKPSRVQETANASAHPSNTQPRPGAHKAGSRAARSAHKDSDISPALRMMSYDTAATPPSSDGGHGRSTHSLSSREMHTFHDRAEQNRSTSPEGGKRKNPSWRKPAPKYIPTPPSTPPSSVSEHLPAATNEPVPPVPSNVHPLSVKLRPTPTQASPPRPARAEALSHIPAMFRDHTAALDSPRARIAPTPASRQFAQASSPSKAVAMITGSLRVAHSQTQPPPQVQPLPQTPPLSQTPSRLQTQAPFQTQTVLREQVQMPIQTTSLADAVAHAQPLPPTTYAQVTAKGTDARVELQKPALVHPQPKKIPSMTQLVSMVIPSRTPSPRVPAPSDNRLSDPAVRLSSLSPERDVTDQTQPHKFTVAARSLSQSLSPKLATRDISSRVPSPAVHAEQSSHAVARTRLQPHQVALPPSTGSSAKSSRSVSPLSSPAHINLSLPARSRSPTPGTSQYTAPPPSFPSPPPNAPSTPLRSVVTSQRQRPPMIVEPEGGISEIRAPVEQRLSVVHERPLPPQSGLVTPPMTPPSPTTCEVVTKNVEAHLKAPVLSARPCSPLPQSPSASVSSLKPTELLPRNDNTIVRDAYSISRSTTPAPMLSSPAPPPTSASSAEKEPDARPELPIDWKETITRATRPNVSRNLLAPAQAPNFDENSSMLPPFGSNLAQVLPEEKDNLTSAYVITGTWLDRAENTTTALGLEIHELEPEQAPNITDEKSSLGDRTEQPLSSSASIRIPHSVTEIVSKKIPVATPTLRQRTIYDSSTTNSPVPAKLTGYPPRSRSPIPRSKTPQRVNGPGNSVQKEEAWPLVSSELGAVFAGPSSYPPTSHTADFTPRSHSSGLPKRSKTPRPRVEEEQIPTQRQKNAQQIYSREFTDLVSATVSPQIMTPELPSTRCISPPPRNQSLGTRKKYLGRGSDTGHTESNDQEAYYVYPSSPPTVAHSLPSSHQAYTEAKSPKGHVHVQRQPAPETAQQKTKPPPSSHYKKKRSNDVLPSEPLSSFMKTPVHYIYPDTSASYGHSLSGESVLATGGTKSHSNIGCVQSDASDDSDAYGGERERQRSASLSSLVSLDKGQEDEELDTPSRQPQVPPKSKRSDVIVHEPHVGRESYPDFTVHRAQRGRYPSAPIGQAKAHTLTLPPNSDRSRTQHGRHIEMSPGAELRPRRTQHHAAKAARSLSEKVERNNNVQPMTRSKSTPVPSARLRQRRGLWSIFGLWARVFVAKFKTWTSPSPSPYDQEYHRDI